MKKSFSERVCAACWILAILIVFAELATAQTVELRKTNPKIPWNNHSYFEARTKTKFLNWHDYSDSWDKKQWVTWAAFAGSGAMWGMREAYHAEPTVFETRWGVSDHSFFGSEAWVRNYRNNDPTQGHKHEWLGNVGRDVHHTFGFGSKALLLGGTFAIGARRQPIKYRVANMAIGWALHSLTATIAYQALR